MLQSDVMTDPRVIQVSRFIIRNQFPKKKVPASKRSVPAVAVEGIRLPMGSLTRPPPPAALLSLALSLQWVVFGIYAVLVG